MNHGERFEAVMKGQSFDRLPCVEWATHWDKTIERWYSQGLPTYLQSSPQINAYFGLDPYVQFWFSPLPIGHIRQEIIEKITSMDDYHRIRGKMFPSQESLIESMQPYIQDNCRGDVVIWISLEGFFWVPRTLLGIEKHMFTFFDNPELIHQMNQDLCRYYTELLSNIFKICKPVFMTFAEDMSYNNGPMISKSLFDEFILPYYQQLIPIFKEKNVFTFVDSDGDVTAMVPWLISAGIDGVLPLERQAGVDAAKIKNCFPEFCMIGHFDKMVMSQGESAIRDEFERILPLMQNGRYVPSVDHQTPPEVTFQNYQKYITLLKHYCSKAAYV